jgi:hypothetical protein
MAKYPDIIALGAIVGISAAAAEGETKGPRSFESTFYTGGALEIEGWEHPVAIDLAGLENGKVLVANLDHERKQRVGNFEAINDLKTLVAKGKATASTPYRDEVIQSADDGYQWQASLEVAPKRGGVEFVKAGQKVTVNGQQLAGPLYVTRKGTLKGFAFVSHGADDNTTASIAATAATSKEPKKMKTEVTAWVKQMLPSLDIDTLTEDQKAGFEADFEGRERVKPTASPAKVNPLQARKIEAQRCDEIREFADNFVARHEGDLKYIEAVEKMVDHAIEAKMTVQEFKNEMYESSVPTAHTVPQSRTRDRGINARVLQAAICATGMLQDVEKQFSDQELQTAHDRFPHGISLNELLILGAEANGHRGSTGGRVTLDVQRAAFSPRQINAGIGYSTIDVANIVAATANKFLHEGWMAVDMTPLKIASVRSVRNFQQITTVSLTGHLQFDKVGADGELKHGVLDDLTYNNQVDTYGRLLAITRKDIINDDLGALTAVPRRLGRGGALKLNDIFWTEFLGLVPGNFFASGNSNINTGVADMSIGGLAATETVFMNQTDPDGKPLGIMPKIILVPTAQKAAASALLTSQGSVLITGASSTIPNANVFQGRFRLESSPYISNSSYTGSTSTGYWMLADPNECPVIEIAALNGKIEPTVETADAEINTLGIVMRGFSDIGVNEQEKRGGVYADGTT